MPLFLLGARLNGGLPPWVVAEVIKIWKTSLKLAPAPRGIVGGKKSWKRDILKERLPEIIRTMAAPIAPKINFREKWAFSSKKASPILSDRYSTKKWQNHRKIIKRIVYMNKKYWIILFLYNIDLYLSNKNYLYMFNILFYWVMMCFQ